MIDLEFMNNWIALQSIPGIGSATLNKLVESFGSPGKVLNASREELRLTIKSKDIIDLILSGNFNNTGKILSDLKSRQFRMITKNDTDYPSLLRSSKLPPPVIYVYGNFPEAKKNLSIAIVGSSRASQDGMQTALMFAKRFAKKRIVVVSGYAKGIDTYAHMGTLLCNGKTIMALPFGVLNFVVHKEFDKVRELLFSNAFMFSEFFPTALWSTGQAMIRNRRISEFADAVIVIEPGEKGGTIATARWARNFKKPIFIYKGISTRRDKELFQLGAIPIETPEEVLDKLR